MGATPNSLHGLIVCEHRTISGPTEDPATKSPAQFAYEVHRAAVWAVILAVAATVRQELAG
jgi:hypothetical protein